MSNASTRDNASTGIGRVRLRPFSRSLPMSLLRAREGLMRQFRPMLREHGLSEQQWRVMRALSAAPALEVTSLAESTFLLGPSLSRILANLEGRKLVKRDAHPDDFRRSLVSITRDGMDLIEIVTPSSEALYSAMTRRIGAKKLAALETLLREVEEALPKR